MAKTIKNDYKCVCTIQFWAPFPKCYFSKFLDHELRDLESNFLDFLGK